MAEEETKPTEQTPTESTPKKELDNTTEELIKEALEAALNGSKPWYKRGLSYVIAVILIVAFYAADQFGPEVVNKIVELVNKLLEVL